MAAALGDDPNFATTTSDLIGTNASDIDAVELRLDAIEADDYVETSHTGDVDIDGNLEIKNSTVSSYSLSFTASDDGDMGGWYQDSSNNSELVLKDGSANIKTLINSAGDSYFNGGNVGIGTDSPSAPLHVNGGSSTGFATVKHLELGNTLGRGLTVSTSQVVAVDDLVTFDAPTSTYGQMAFNTAGSERMRITSGGQVLVDTASSQTTASFAVRRNGGNIEFGHKNTSSGYYGQLGAMYTNGDPYISFSCDNDGIVGGDNFRTRGFKGNVISGTTTGELVFSQATNPNSTSQGLTERMRIDSAGNVGIGTESPSNNLHIKGDADGEGLTIQRNSTTSGAYADLMFSVSTSDNATPNAKIRATRGTGYDDTDISIITNSTERMRIDSDGNVGIGTDAPSAPLHVKGASNASTRIRLELNDSGNSINLDQEYGGIEWVGNDGQGDGVRADVRVFGDGTSGETYMTFGTKAAGFTGSNSATERMRIDSSGNVGIGENTPTRPLTVSGGTSTNTPILVKATSKNSAYIAFQDSGTSGELYNRIGSSSNALVFRANNAERMRINPAGNVGIGETNPSYKLDVHNGTAGSGIARFSGADSDDMIIVTESGYMAIDTRNTGSGLSFQIQGDDKVRIDSSGNVGIGTDLPSEKLEVDGDVKSESIRLNGGDSNPTIFMERGGGTDVPVLQLNPSTDNVTIGHTAIDALVFHDDSGEAMRLDGSGNLGIGTPTPGSLLHIHQGDSGGTSNVAANEVIIEGSGDTGMTISTPSTNIGTLAFGDNDVSLRGALRYDHTDDSMQLRVASAERMRIDSDGNVGIGTDLPERNLHVSGSSIITTKIEGQNSGHLVELNNNSDSPAYNGLRFSYGSTSKMAISHITDGNTKGYIQIGNNWNTGDEILTVDGRNSNVGIGTTSPGAKLDVNGTIKATAINFSGLPTSSTGLSTGDVWNDGGTLKIVS